MINKILSYLICSSIILATSMETKAACSDYNNNESKCISLENNESCVYKEITGSSTSCHSCLSIPTAGSGDSRNFSTVFDDATGDFHKLIGDSIRNNLILNTGMIWCHNVDMPLVQGDSIIIEDSMRLDWDANDFVSNNYFKPLWLSNTSGKSILLALSAAISPLSLSGMHDVDLAIKLGKGRLVIDQDSGNPVINNGISNINLLTDIFSLIDGMSASNTDESTSVLTSDFGVSFSYVSSVSKNELVQFVENNTVPSGIISVDSSKLSSWSLSDLIVLVNNTEGFSNTAEGLSSSVLGISSSFEVGQQNLISNGSTVRLKSSFGLEEVFVEGENAISSETSNNSLGATDFESLINNFSNTFNNRQVKRRELRDAEKIAASLGKSCSEDLNCIQAKVSLNSVENNFSRSTRRKLENGFFEPVKSTSVSLGKINPGTVNPSTGDIDFGMSIIGGSVLHNPEKFFENKYNNQYEGRYRPIISNNNIIKAIESRGTASSNTIQLINFISNNTCDSNSDCVEGELCINGGCSIDKNQSDGNNYMTVSNNNSISFGSLPSMSEPVPEGPTAPQGEVVDDSGIFGGQEVTPPTLPPSSNVTYNNNSGVIINKSCVFDPDDNLFLSGNKIIEVLDSSLNAVCIDSNELEPKEIGIALNCTNNQLQVAGDINSCNSFDPINFNCLNYNSGWNFIVEQTNLTHFSYNGNTLNFEDTITLNNISGDLLTQVNDKKILSNPFGMGFAACKHFSTSTDPQKYIVDETDETCLWKDPNNPSCYGKYRIDFSEEFFFHPSYHGPLVVENSSTNLQLPGYQNPNRTFDTVHPVETWDHNGYSKTFSDSLDGNNDGWFTYEMMPFSLYNITSGYNYNSRAMVTLPYNRTKLFNHIFTNGVNSLVDAKTLREDFRADFQAANDFVYCQQRQNGFSSGGYTCDKHVANAVAHGTGGHDSSVLFNYESIKRHYYGRGGIVHLARTDSASRIFNATGTCKETVGTNVHYGCRNLIITDHKTCVEKYKDPANIPEHTEISCMPPKLEIVFNPLANHPGGDHLNLFNIHGYNNVKVENLTIKAYPGTSMSQAWKVARILENLTYDNGSFSCTENSLVIDENTSCLNANAICSNLTTDLAKCKDKIAREFFITHYVKSPHQTNSTNGHTDGDETIAYSVPNFLKHEILEENFIAGSPFKELVYADIPSSNFYKGALFSNSSDYLYSCIGNSNVEEKCNATYDTPNLSKYERQNLINLIPFLRNTYDVNQWINSRHRDSVGLQTPASFIFKDLVTDLNDQTTFGEMLCGDGYITFDSTTRPTQYAFTEKTGTALDGEGHLFSLLQFCPNQTFYTVLRAIAQQYSPFENIISFDTVFRFNDNVNVNFSNVLIQTTAYDGAFYGLANRYVQFDGVQIQGIPFSELKYFHVPVDDDVNGLKRLSNANNIGFGPNSSSLLSFQFPGKNINTLSLMTTGIKIENSRDDDGKGIEYPLWERRSASYSSDDDIFPYLHYNPCYSKNLITPLLSGTTCNDSSFFFMDGMQNALTDEQFLSPFYETGAGPEKLIENSNPDFNFYDADYLFSDVQFQNRAYCSYLEARAYHENDDINPIFPGDETPGFTTAPIGYYYNDNNNSYHGRGYELKECVVNSDCVANLPNNISPERKLELREAVCMGGFCKSSACDTEYVSVTHTTIQNSTWNTMDVDTNFSWKNSKWKSLKMNDDGISFRSNSGLIFNSDIKNLATDTLFDIQHRDQTSRGPSSFDHVRISRNIFSLGRTKSTSTGSYEDTMTFENNLFLNASIGGYNKEWRPFWINNSIVMAQGIYEDVQDTQTDYKEFSEKIFRQEAATVIHKGLPYSGQRFSVFNNSVISSATDIGNGVLFLQKFPTNYPPGYRLAADGNVFMISRNAGVHNFASVANDTNLGNTNWLNDAPMSGGNALVPKVTFNYTQYQNHLFYDALNSLGDTAPSEWDDNYPLTVNSGDYSNRINFVKDFCYAEVEGTSATPILDLFKDKANSASISNINKLYFLQHWPNHKDHYYQCHLGGANNFIENSNTGGTWPLGFFVTLYKSEIDDPSEVVSLTDPFFPTFNKNTGSTTKCDSSSTNNYISNKIRENKSPSFHAMGRKYRNYRDWYGHFRKVRTTAGAFEDYGLDSSGCR